MDYEAWKKDINGKFKNIEFEKWPQIIKRCPRCLSITLEFEVNTGKVKCTKCGFEESLPILK